MGLVGTFGPLVFQTSDKTVFTPSDLKQEIAGQWGEHKLIAQKPKQEFLGPGARIIKFSMILDVMLGLQVRWLLEVLEFMTETGYVDYMIIGNKAIGDNQFVITSVSEAWDVVYSGGELAKATVEVTMREYR